MPSSLTPLKVISINLNKPEARPHIEHQTHCDNHLQPPTDFMNGIGADKDYRDFSPSVLNLTSEQLRALTIYHFRKTRI